MCIKRKQSQSVLDKSKYLQIKKGNIDIKSKNGFKNKLFLALMIKSNWNLSLLLYFNRLHAFKYVLKTSCIDNCFTYFQITLFPS